MKKYLWFVFIFLAFSVPPHVFAEEASSVGSEEADPFANRETGSSAPGDSRNLDVEGASHNSKAPKDHTAATWIGKNRENTDPRACCEAHTVEAPLGTNTVPPPSLDAIKRSGRK